jgi:NTP pyrophosphatase (non-canonical NTP hydrolase)
LPAHKAIAETPVAELSPLGDWCFGRPRERTPLMDTTYTFQELIEITRRVVAAFDAVEQRPWTIEATMIELMKQVGDLSKHIMMYEGYYLQDRATDSNYQTSKEDIADELADILYCLIRIAEQYQIDLEQAHLQARRKEMAYLGKEIDF